MDKKETATAMTTTIEELKESADLPAIVEMLTGEPKRNGSYHCPICGSGSGPHHTPALSIDPKMGLKHWHCFACERQGDVFDLAGWILGDGERMVEDFMEQRQQVETWIDELGLGSEGGTGFDVAGTRGLPVSGLEASVLYVEDCRRAIEDPDAVSYLGSRGIGLEDARRLGLGYDAARRRVVIPFPGVFGYHIDRSIDGGADHKYDKPRGVTQPIWNPGALEGDVIVVVEGPLDAISLDLAGFGGRVVALCGTAWRSLLSELRARNWRGSVLVALDADDVGTQAGDDFVGNLLESRIAAAKLDTWERRGAKDASELWARDPDALRDAMASDLEAGVQSARENLLRAGEKEYTEIMGRLHAVDAATALRNVLELASPIIPVQTGFEGLDNVLGGGLGPGLYVLGAVSSIGKTTFVGQMAEVIATTHHPVLFVTLEQSADEMAAKSVSRWMSERPWPDGKHRDQGAWNLMRPSWRNGPDTDSRTRVRIREACESLERDLGGRLQYVVGDSEPSVADVSAVAFHMRDRYGVPPVIFIDYLQLLRTPDDSLSTKQAVDRNVFALRRLARDLWTPVVAISSLNRASYSGAVTMEAFKESGSIEYSSDVLLGIQPFGMGAELEKKSEQGAKREGKKMINDAKSEADRKVEVTVLKNRWGRCTGYKNGIAMVYHAIGNYFKETNPLMEFKPNFLNPSSRS